MNVLLPAWIELRIRSLGAVRQSATCRISTCSIAIRFGGKDGW
ncbi:hypothetical protein BQ8794_60150 [Mesorhizobium prunaredense]|uniref:Uncharacterized protein n=1 Tax=Mesorhizobium prunaredense TaxID=1631249 RepID=A0A1R3VG55_9HYPH|nr:hypothetical protein BQ8794_60150 [Mesorhizobium prunaredense]